MSRVKIVLIVLVVIVASCYPVFAEESNNENKWYVKSGLGYANQIKNYNEVNFGASEWNFDDGLNMSLSAGYAALYWALEGEFAFRIMHIDHKTLKSSSSKLNYEGDQTQAALMLNGYLFPFPEWIISPYVGGGLGATRISWNEIKVSGSSSSGIDDYDTVFTYQFIIGASYDITPKMTLEADYRYYVPDNAEIKSSAGSVGEMDNQELNILNLFIKYKL